MADLKVLKFAPKENKADKKYKNVYQKAYFELFQNTSKQDLVINEISKDVGGLFNMINLPKGMMIELIGAGTMKVLYKDLVFKKKYAEMLTGILDYLEYTEGTDKNACRE